MAAFDTPPRGALAEVVHDGRADTVAVEEPLEIRVGDEPVAVTMRTPGHDEELALGFLFGEGLIEGPRPAGLSADLAVNVIVVTGRLRRALPSRRFYTTSSCGVCGKGAIEEVTALLPAPVAQTLRVGRGLLADLPNRLVRVR
jgi:FdhD protein